MATVRPPRKGPMQRQRISPKSFGSKGGPPCTSESASVLSMEWRANTGTERIQQSTNPIATPRENQVAAAGRRDKDSIRHLSKTERILCQASCSKFLAMNGRQQQQPKEGQKD